MNVLVLGNDGQLGRELARAAWPAQWRLHAPTREVFDLGAPATLRRLLERYPFDLLVNAAAYTAVDQAESEPEKAFAANRDGPGLLAELCAQRERPMIHVSTDYVFDGMKAEPYAEDDPVCPVNVYGASKLAGEEAIRQNHQAHIILRTSWLYSPFGHNFVRTMIRLASEREEVRVVSDQRGCPTAAGDLAAAIVRIAETIALEGSTAWGTYHHAGGGEATWFDLAECVFQTLETSGERRPRLTAIDTAQFPTPAARPINSVLDCTKIRRTFGIEPRPWRDGCRAVVQECLAQRQEVA